MTSKTTRRAGTPELWGKVDKRPPPPKSTAAASTVTLSQLRQDAADTVRGWFSNRTGAGDPERDKIGGLQWAGSVRMEKELLQSLFAYNDLSRTIVSALPEWSLRHGWTLKLRAPEAGSKLPPSMQAADLRMRVEDELVALEAHTNQRDAAIWGQLYGGGLLLLGLADGGTSAEELNEEELDRVEYLRSVERSDVRIVSFDGDPDSARFGKPVEYEVRQNVSARVANVQRALEPVNQGGFTVEVWHHTRVVLYPGALTPRDLKIQNDGWDHSLLDHVITKLKQTDGIWDNVAAMVADGSQGVWKIKGLFQAVVSGNLDKIESRFTIADKARSMFRSLLLDADQESFEYVHREFGGIADLLAQSAIRTAAAAQMPVTVLYGQSPAGLNATGESDIRLWYDRVEQYQTDVIVPGLRRIVRLVLASNEGPTKGVIPPGWAVEMKPVRKATPMETGELAARQAQTDTAYIEKRVLTADEVAVSRFTPGGLSFETHINPESRRVRLEAARKAASAAEVVDTPAIPLAPTDLARVVRGREARGSIDLVPFGDERDELTIAELAARTAAPAPGAAPGGVPPPPPTPRADQGAHVHSLPGGGRTGEGEGSPQHDHSLPGGGRTLGAEAAPGHTHVIPQSRGGGRTGPPIEAGA